MVFLVKRLFRYRGISLGIALFFFSGALAADLCRIERNITTPVNFPQKTSYFLAIGGIVGTSLDASGLVCRGKLDVSSFKDQIWSTVNSNTATDGNKSYLVHTEDPNYKIMFQTYYDKNYNDAVKFGQKRLAFENKWFQDIIVVGKDNRVPLFFRIFPERNIRYISGTYEATITNFWEWEVCNPGFTSIDWGFCVGISKVERGSGLVTTKIRMNVLGDCVIKSDKDSLNFGTRPFIQDFDPVTNTITVNCTSDIKDYSIGVSMGENSDGIIRNMKSLSGENIAYQIYKGNSKEVWAGYHEPKDSANRRGKMEADSNGVAGQVFKYTAEILSGQSPKPQADYQDEVIIDFAF